MKRSTESPQPVDHEVVGPKGKHNRDRAAKRHGHEDGSMTLGGRRVAVRRPRMRTADDEHELPVQTYGYFADRDPLTRAVMDRMLAGVSTRKFKRTTMPRRGPSRRLTAVSGLPFARRCARPLPGWIAGCR
jgi:hypothetical protein